MDTIPNMNLTTTERIELAAAAAAYKASEAIREALTASADTKHQEMMERVQRIADMIDARERRNASKDKWFVNVLNYAASEFKKYFL